jgi:hypothetical protein
MGKRLGLYLLSKPCCLIAFMTLLSVKFLVIYRSRISFSLESHTSCPAFLLDIFAYPAKGPSPAVESQEVQG